jgi:hypothetical protein
MTEIQKFMQWVEDNGIVDFHIHRHPGDPPFTNEGMAKELNNMRYEIELGNYKDVSEEEH